MTAPLLDGYTIGVTADRRAEEQCEMLRRRGARVLRGPSIRTVPLVSDDRIRAATDALIASPTAVLIANTGIGIRSWFAAAESWGIAEALMHALARTRVVARGPKAAGAVLTAGLSVSWRAPSETLADAVAHVLDTAPQNTSVALQLDGNAEQREVERLRDAGMRVVPVRVYEWSEPSDVEPARKLVRAVCEKRVDAVTFTSAAAVQTFAALAEADGRLDAMCDAINHRVIAMCVGPVCTQAAQALGLRGMHPARPRLGAMIHRLTEELAQRRRHLRLGGADVVAQGAALRIDGQPVTLSERERSVFDILLERNGAVASRSELRRAVWGPDSDAHALEVTITRLRRKLGAARPAIHTVTRRGYRLVLD